MGPCELHSLALLAMYWEDCPVFATGANGAKGRG